MPVVTPWVQRQENHSQTQGKAVATTPPDVFLRPHTPEFYYAEKDIIELFTMPGEKAPEKVFFNLASPDRHRIKSAVEKNPAESNAFWERVNELHYTNVTVGTNSETKLDDYRRSTRIPMSAACYLALYYGINGDTPMLQIFGKAVPPAVASLVPTFHDLLTRNPDLAATAQQGHQGQVPSRSSGQTVPNVASYKVVIEACARAAADCGPAGATRLREIERGARMVTHYLADHQGLGKYLKRHDPKQQKEEDNMIAELEKAISATKPAQNSRNRALLGDNQPRTYAAFAHDFFLSKKSNVDPIFQDIRKLFHDIIPSNIKSVNDKEHQAICVAIVAVGIANFGNLMVQRYEAHEKRTAKIIEVVGAILGMEPHAGTIITAVATVAKTISDAVYEHKIDKVKVIKTLGRRITAAFLLDRTDLSESNECASQDSLLYTRILSAIYGITY